jgi:hypothetical protein
MKTVYTFDEHVKSFPSLTVSQRQALGVEAVTARPLAIDGAAGPRTQSGMFVSATSSNPLLDTALYFLFAEAREEGGNNMGSWVEAFMTQRLQIRGNPNWRSTIRGGQQGSWCSGFTSKCIQETFGQSSSYSWSARALTTQILRTGKRIQARDCQAGDIICWQEEIDGKPVSGHVGIVFAVFGDFVFVIEGNGSRRLGQVSIYAYRISTNLQRGKQALWAIARLP